MLSLGFVTEVRFPEKFEMRVATNHTISEQARRISYLLILDIDRKVREESK